MPDAPPKAPSSREMSGEVALAVCIAKTLHSQNDRFLQVLRPLIDEMLQDEQYGPEAHAALYAFALALDQPETFS